jgi:hypothetical protein
VLVVALPRTAIALAWALVAIAAVIALFGPLFGLSTAVVNASLFASGPVPTGEGVDPRGIVLSSSSPPSESPRRSAACIVGARRLRPRISSQA